MYINPCLFVLARPPHQVIWNYERHTQFELDLHYSTRLAQLIANPLQFDINNSIDADFMNANILIEEPGSPIEWHWDELSRIFHIGTKNIPCAQVPRDVNEWATEYLQHCNEVLSSPVPPDRTRTYPADRIVLPPCTLIDMPDVSLPQTLVERRTSRSFSKQAISIEQVGTLLYLALGYLNERRGTQGATCPDALGARRSSPSGEA
ncbi:protein of unknown function [Pseudomonas mediterranea]